MKDVEKIKKKYKKKNETRKDGFFVVEGLNAVLEYLKFKPESLRFIVYKKKIPQELLVAKKHEIKLIEADVYSEDDSGYFSRSPLWACVQIGTKKENDLEKIIQGTQSGSILVLDHITDPRNLGAIARTAAFYGIRHVIVAKDRQVLLTQSSVATAQGAFALLDLVVVTNIARVVDQLKQDGFWVVGTTPEGRPFEELTQIDHKDNLVIILGSEEKGISQRVQKACDWLVSIDGAGSSLNSLNVSVAAGIFCDRIHQIRKKDPRTT